MVQAVFNIFCNTSAASARIHVVLVNLGFVQAKNICTKQIKCQSMMGSLIFKMFKYCGKKTELDIRIFSFYPTFVAFVEDNTTMSSIRNFENHVSYFVEIEGITPY